MTDVFDNASDLEALHRDLAIKAIRGKNKATYTGYCRYCNETIEKGSFCSAECREGQELEDKLKGIKGFR
jgi:hypothetical protein